MAMKRRRPIEKQCRWHVLLRWNHHQHDCLRFPSESKPNGSFVFAGRVDLPLIFGEETSGLFVGCNLTSSATIADLCGVRFCVGLERLGWCVRQM